MRKRITAKAAAAALRAKKKGAARKLQEYDSKEGPNDEPDSSEESLPRHDDGIQRPPVEEGRSILTPKDDTALRTRVVDDGSAGKTASQAVKKRKADVKAAGAFARRQLAKAGLGTRGTDAEVAARFREANHAVAQRRTDEGLKRAKTIGASSALAANKANSKAELEAQERARARVATTRAAATQRARASATVVKTAAAAKAKAAAAVSAQKAKVVTQITGRPPAGTRVPNPAPGRPAPKPVAPKKPKKPARKVGGGRHLS